MKKQFLTIAAFVALAFAMLPSSALAGNTVDTNSLVGAQGYDLVSYHSGTPQKGTGSHLAEHNGVTYIFASEANKEAFEASPAAYIPAFGGYCAYAVSQGYTASGDPKAWKIVDDKLYVNYSPAVKEKWVKDIPKFIADANNNWKNLADKAEESRKDKK